MTAITVRAAREEDWREVASLLAELGRPDVLGGPDESAHRDAYAAYLQRDDVEALVAERDRRVIGFVNVEFRPRLHYTSPQAWVAELIVTEGARSSGAGAALLGRAEELAWERGCWSIALESGNWRSEAHRFYKREGWTDAAKAFFKQPP